MDPDTERDFVEYVANRTTALVRLAYTLTGDQHAAEDLVQSALAKAFPRWRGIRSDAEPYVRKVIYHECVSRWRRVGHRAERSMAQVPDRPIGDGTEQTDLRLALRSALLSLPVRQRAALVLRYLEDMSVEEAAEVLGCRPATVASQASRALAKLRDMVPELELLPARARKPEAEVAP
jgi:RNA polymerase sigma-70 factor (sigma-E family)